MTRIPFGTYRRFKPLIAALQRLLDPLVVIACLWAVLRLHHLGLQPIYGVLMVLSALLTAVVFTGTGLYRSWRAGATRVLMQRIVLAWMMVMVVLLALGYALKGSALYSRLVIFIWAAVVPVVLCLLHGQIRWFLVWLRRTGRNLRFVVFVGANEAAVRMAADISAERALGMVALGVFDDAPAADFPLPCLGAVAEVPAFVRDHEVDIIYITLPPQPEGPLPALLDALQAFAVAIYFVPDLLVFGLLEARVEEFHGTPVLAVGEARVNEAAGLVKWAIDVALSGMILVALSPLLVAIALGVRLSSPGPVFFRQRRYGLAGEPILVWKFRTMRVCEDGPAIRQAQAGDARVTRLGAWLRRTSLDELPQFLNVLAGQMSIVGPRPHAIAHNELYRHLIPGYMLRHRVKPGITGWAQIHGLRGETDTVEKMQSRVEYDLYYIRHWSVLMDLQIIANTPWTLLRRTNAY